LAKIDRRLRGSVCLYDCVCVQTGVQLTCRAPTSMTLNDHELPK